VLQKKVLLKKCKTSRGSYYGYKVTKYQTSRIYTLRDWGKGYGRKGAALVGLGQAGEGVKAYLAGLQVEPGNEFLKEGLREAKESIKQHQARYEEMWGKNN